jgi:hypothetical protein
MITLGHDLECPRKYCTDRGKQHRRKRVFTAVFFSFYKWIVDCKTYAVVQILPIKQS